MEELKYIDETGCYYPAYLDYFLSKYAASIGLYNSELADLVVKVMEESSLTTQEETPYYTSIAARLNVDERIVEIIKDVLSASDIMEYGTSPRGAWLTDEGETHLKLIKEDYRNVE